jgi:hypothetical protein
MADSDNYRKFSQVVRGICDDGRSGTLFVRTSDNHASMVLFDKGDITGAYFGSLKGRKAIAMLRMSDGLTYNFEEGRPPTVRHDLRSPAETLVELIGDTASAAKPAVVTLAAAKSVAQTAGISDKLGLGNVIARILARELAKYIGPAAQGVVGNAERGVLATATHDQMLSLISKLAADLLEPDEQSRFQRDVIPQIDRVFKGEGLAAVAAQFVESLGPVARSVWERVLAESGGEVRDPGEMDRLIASLVREIDNPNEAQEFVTRVRRALEALASW